MNILHKDDYPAPQLTDNDAQNTWQFIKECNARMQPYWKTRVFSLLKGVSVTVSFVLSLFLLNLIIYKLRANNVFSVFNFGLLTGAKSFPLLLSAEFLVVFGVMLTFYATSIFGIVRIKRVSYALTIFVLTIALVLGGTAISFSGVNEVIEKSVVEGRCSIVGVKQLYMKHCCAQCEGCLFPGIRNLSGRTCQTACGCSIVQGTIKSVEGNTINVDTEQALMTKKTIIVNPHRLNEKMVREGFQEGDAIIALVEQKPEGAVVRNIIKK